MPSFCLVTCFLLLGLKGEAGKGVSLPGPQGAPGPSGPMGRPGIPGKC